FSQYPDPKSFDVRLLAGPTSKKGGRNVVRRECCQRTVLAAREKTRCQLKRAVDLPQLFDVHTHFDARQRIRSKVAAVRDVKVKRCRPSKPRLAGRRKRKPDVFSAPSAVCTEHPSKARSGDDEPRRIGGAHKAASASQLFVVQNRAKLR